MSVKPQSPCQQVCRLDDTRSYCRTCRRTLPEIATWGRMAPEDRAHVMNTIDQRDETTLLRLAQEGRPKK